MRMWKFELKITDIQDVMMPAGAMIRSVAEQNGKLCLWAQVRPEQPKVPRSIEIIGTGNPIYEGMGTSREFVGTVVMNPFVWHVFERTA